MGSQAEPSVLAQAFEDDQESENSISQRSAEEAVRKERVQANIKDFKKLYSSKQQDAIELLSDKIFSAMDVDGNEKITKTQIYDLMVEMALQGKKKIPIERIEQASKAAVELMSEEDSDDITRTSFAGYFLRKQGLM